VEKEKVYNFQSSLDIAKGHNTLRPCIITIQHLNFACYYARYTTWFRTL